MRSDEIWKWTKEIVISVKIRCFHDHFAELNLALLNFTNVRVSPSRTILKASAVFRK